MNLIKSITNAFQPIQNLSQPQRMLLLLRSKKFITLPEIMDLKIASHTKVISNLRKEGYAIDNKEKYVKGVWHSTYELVKAES